MKKVQLLAAAAVLFASSAYAQSGTRAEFQAVNACQGCDVELPTTRPVDETNPNEAPSPTGLASIDNCSVVIQGGEGKDKSSNNVAVVDQLGRGNHASLTQREGGSNYGLQVQDGNNNNAGAEIWGSRNTTIQLQTGNRNRAGINVDQVTGEYDPNSKKNGSDNWAEQRQNGNNNDADIQVRGNKNYASQDQDGNRNSASIYQHVNSSSAFQSQVGNGNTAITNQGDITSNSIANVKNQMSCIEQGGNNNQAIVTQNNK